MRHDDAGGVPPASAGNRLNRALVPVKELNEMTIARTDDPENPFRVSAFEAAGLHGAGS